MGWSDAGDTVLLSASRSDPDAFMAFCVRFASGLTGFRAVASRLSLRAGGLAAIERRMDVGKE
ncbi:MAG: hypothetical protein ACLP0J_26070 [Solirubrobacteraceae bacterium]